MQSEQLFIGLRDIIITCEAAADSVLLSIFIIAVVVINYGVTSIGTI